MSDDYSWLTDQAEHELKVINELRAEHPDYDDQVAKLSQTHDCPTAPFMECHCPTPAERRDEAGKPCGCSIYAAECAHDYLD